ncbi:hypothetical protein [Legionella sp. W05-934-2]|jgi:tyrosine-protein phosphatase YwqE|uniref:hypothetical protein n=1 Tax=Legionella sp. W05-934-2 TaxID=1198649 RepID=UPI0034630BE9
MALSHTKQPGFESVKEDSAEVLTYIHSLYSDDALEILRADLNFIRVIEDVIDILMKKNIVTITDFHPAVIEKLLKRQTIRRRLSGSISMDFDEDEESL